MPGPDQEQETEEQQSEPQPSPNMVRINFSVPAALYAEIVAMAAHDGLKVAELNRFCWMNGIDGYVEGLNKRLVNSKLRATAAATIAKNH